MNIYYGMSDIGSVLIGNNDWTFAVPNIGGDGETKIVICENDEDFTHYKSKHRGKLDFISSVQGYFNIYNYDCAYHNIQDATVLTTLYGRYGVYSGEYVVVFVRWGTLAD